GKTEAGKALAVALDTPLVRLQCYDGIDVAEALYEWNYPRQLLSIRLADAAGAPLTEDDLFGPDYLIRRPLLRALEHPGPRPAGPPRRGSGRRRRRLRALPPRASRGGARDHPGDRHDRRHAPADHRADLQPHARPPRCRQAPLPLPVDRLPHARARGGDRPPP